MRRGREGEGNGLGGGGVYEGMRGQEQNGDSIWSGTRWRIIGRFGEDGG